MKNIDYAKTKWDENGHLVAEDFGDVYFSIIDGLEETKHVFLTGNNLPKAWENKEKFTIIETGFGTGLNFLATWELWRNQSGNNKKLHFISVEKHPLKVDVFNQMQKKQESLAPLYAELASYYPQLIQNKVNSVTFGNVTLTLLIGDVLDVLPLSPQKADAWFLDGFSPAKNPRMWNIELYKQMATLSNPQATLATFTAAGHVRKGLEEAGFNIERIKGFAYKRHMSIGTLKK